MYDEERYENALQPKYLFFFDDTGQETSFLHFTVAVMAALILSTGTDRLRAFIP